MKRKAPPLTKGNDAAVMVPSSGAKCNVEDAPVALEPISIEESADFVRLEKIIERGLETFVEVGEALAAIRDRKLYRIAHSTFESYCREKWKMTPQHARRLCIASKVVAGLKMEPTGSIPSTERQVRPLTKLPPEKRAEAFQAAVAASPTGTPTAKDVEAVVERIASTQEMTASFMRWMSKMSTDQKKRYHLSMNGGTVLANQSTDKALIEAAGSDAVYIGRGTPFGNPFILDGDDCPHDGDRDKVCDLFRDHYLPHKKDIHTRLPELHGKVLVCHCYPKRCHGLSIIAMIEKEDCE